MPTQIYLDNNATTFLDHEISDSMREVERSGLANPASQHRFGRRALHLIESSKESILENLGAPATGMSAAQVILTSGGSEANNLALHAFTHQRSGLVIVGSTEHPSILVAAELSALCLNPVRLLPVLPSGKYDVQRLDEWLQAIYSGCDQHQQVALISLMLANNETGVTQPIAEVARLCQRYSIALHCDIVQAVGKVPFNMSELGVSAVTVNAHKLHGPVGIGALVVEAGLQARPMIVGGGQQLGWRAGTEPVALAVGFATSLQVASKHRRAGAYDRVAQLRDRFEAQLANELNFVQVNGAQDDRLPQTSNLAFLGVDRQALQMALDLEGIACSAGAACASGSSRPSTTLLAMQLDDQRVRSSLRFSLSRMTSDEEIDQAVRTIIRIAPKLRNC